MININIELKNEVETEFLELQKKLGLENKTDVLRLAIKLANKKITI